jgi:hypothetical protein
MTVNECHQRLGVEKFFLHELAEVVAMRSLLRGIMAVWREIKGIGTRRKSATTANQSASAPTIAASAMAFTR